MAKKRCPHCGSSMVEYKHGMGKGLARILFKIAKYTKCEVKRFEFANLKLNYNHASNMQKLRYWGLLEKIKTDDGGKGGSWTLTRTGVLFITGVIPVSKSAWTYRGDFQRFEGDPVFITDVTDGWKYRPEYANEAVSHDNTN